MENSNMKAFPHFNVNAETTLQMDTSKKGPGANLIQKEKDIPVTDTFSRVTPMNPEDNIQLPIRKANMITTRILTCISTHILMSVQPCPPICLCWLLGRKEKKFLSAVTVCLYSVSHVVHVLSEHAQY